MSNQQYREPPIDKASTRAIVETIVGESNRDVAKGNWIVHKARIISGNMNRFFGLLDHLQSLGVNSERLNSIRVSLAGTTIGFSKEIPEYGMRGEAINIITLQQLPKKETVTNTQSGLIRRGVRPTQQPQEEQPVE